MHLSRTLLVWRITSRRHAGHPFDGEGARRFGGRWNRPGTAVVYTSENLSLAALEHFVHLDPDTSPTDLVIIGAELPPGLSVRTLAISDLPPGWRTYPAPEALQELGTAWARSGEAAALSVPSAVIPRERNLLLNPAHPDMATLRVLAPEPFSFDPRMWK